jgi:hypothetical protein
MTAKSPKTRKTYKSRQNRLRAPPSPLAFAYTIHDAQAMGAWGKTVLYQMLQDGRLERAPGPGTRITGDSLRRALGVKAQEIAAAV